jgi:hypothetical protein
MRTAHDARADPSVLVLRFACLVRKSTTSASTACGNGSRAPSCKNICGRIGTGSWLNQLGDVILGPGISPLSWTSDVVKQPHHMPPPFDRMPR